MVYLCFFYFLFPILSEGKISPDEPPILPPLPIVPKSEKRKIIYGTPQSKRLDCRDRDWDRERDRDFELMPPPGSQKKDFVAPIDADQPIDPNEPTYCVCHQVLTLVLHLQSFSFEHFYTVLSDDCYSYDSKTLPNSLNCNNYLDSFQVSFGDMIACDNENVSSFSFTLKIFSSYYVI